MSRSRSDHDNVLRNIHINQKLTNDTPPRIFGGGPACRFTVHDDIYAAGLGQSEFLDVPGKGRLRHVDVPRFQAAHEVVLTCDLTAPDEIKDCFVPLPFHAL